MGQLDGKTVVVTGGNSGIGEAVVTAMAKEGANVVIDYIAHPDAAQQLVTAIEQAGGRAVAVEADITKAADLHRMIQTAVDEFGRLDVLVNNAGIETRQSLLDTTEEAFDRVVAVNLRSAFFGSQAAAKQFVQQGGGGLVITMSSVHEDWPMQGNIAYCVSKGGLRMMTRTAGVELGGQGIRFVNIAPGAVDTAINASESADDAQILDRTIPLGRKAQPSDIAGLAVYLASGNASYMTSTTVTIDGGMTQYGPGL